MSRPPRRVRAAAADELLAHCREARDLFLEGDRREATKAYLHSLLLFLEAMDPDGLENVERPLAILDSDVESLERGVAVDWLKPAERGAGPKPLSDEEWMRRAVQAAALSFWMARHKGRDRGARAIATIVYGPTQASAKAAEIIGWRKALEAGEPPAKAVAAYRELCGTLRDLPPDLSSEERFPELVRLLLQDDLTRSKDFRTLYGRLDPRTAGR